MHWIYLFFAGLLEVAWAFSMKHSDGFTKLGPSLLTVLLMIFSFWLLALALRELPISTAYAVWTGIGAVGTAILGIVLLGESATAGKIFCLVLIGIGIIGLKVISKD